MNFFKREFTPNDLSEGGTSLNDPRSEPLITEVGADFDPGPSEHDSVESPAIEAGRNYDAHGRNPRKLQWRKIVHAQQVANGAMVMELDRPREGYTWFVERLLVRTSGVGNLTLFDGNPSGPENTLWYSGNLAANVPAQDSAAYPIYVPETRALFAVAGGGIANGDTWIVRLQVREEEMLR